MPTIRSIALLEAAAAAPSACEPHAPFARGEDLSTLYGRDVFTLHTMRERLPKDVFRWKAAECAAGCGSRSTA